MTALAVIEGRPCPVCFGETETATTDQPALLRHGGYGATLRTTRRNCPSCGRGREVDRIEIAPAKGDTPE